VTAVARDAAGNITTYFLDGGYRGNLGRASIVKEGVRGSLIPDSGSGDPRQRVHPVFVWLVALLMVGGIVVMFASRSSEPAHWSIQWVQAEFRRVDPPVNATSAGDLQTLSKYRLISVKNRYLFAGPPQAVLEHYRTELTGKGWRFHEHFSGGQGAGEDYCKQDLLASVEILGSRSGQGVLFELAMSSSGMSERKCG
jgi:hypothetical protein